MYGWRNNEARARNHCWRGQAVSISYSYSAVCVCVRACECMWTWCTSAGVCLRACSLTYPAYHAPPYCLRPPWLHNIFRHYLTKSTIFRKNKLRNTECVFSFSLQLLLEMFLILRRIRRLIVKNMKTSSFKVHVILVAFWRNLNFFPQIFEKKVWNIKFYQKSVQWEPSCSLRIDRQTDTHTRTADMAKLILTFRRFANASQCA